MNSMVIYASRTGNTRRIAEAVAKGLGSRGTVRVLASEEAPAAVPDDVDLVVVGGPTEAHRMTEPLIQLFGRLGPDGLRGKAAAAFDTRLSGPLWLWGSAGAGIAQELGRSGARVVAPPESFFVTMRGPELKSAELDRAERWAAALAESSEVAAPVASR